MISSNVIQSSHNGFESNQGFDERTNKVFREKQKNLDKLKLVDYLTEQQVHQSETQITLRKIFRSENNSLTPSQAQINQLITLTKFIQKIKQPNFRIFSLASPPVAKTKSPIGPLALLTPPLILTPDP